MTSVNNRQATLALNYSLDISGAFPVSGPLGSTIGLGALRLYGFNFEPDGPSDNLSNDTDGTTFTIASQTALFTLLGTTYGGDGANDFSIPDLGDRIAVGRGTGPGLTERNAGDTFGSGTFDLVLDNVPAALGGGGVPVDNTEPSQVVTHAINIGGVFPGGVQHGFLGQVQSFASVNANGLPAGWVAAEGQLLSVSGNPALFSVLGTTYGGDGISTFALPDLRGRAIVGTGTGPGEPSLGDVLGSEQVTLTAGQLPSAVGGNDDPFDNMQPSLALNYLVATGGNFPSSSGAGPDGDTPFLGEIVAFAGVSVPSGWMLAQGQLLAIASSPALFSLFGTNYGGDGNVSFALPDLGGRAPVDEAAGRTLGSLEGENQTVLTEANLDGAVEPGSLVVTIAADTVDPFDNETSLREALAFANDATANGGSGDADNDGDANDTITFDASLAGQTLTLAAGDLEVRSDVTILGDVDGDNDIDITLSGGTTDRILDVDGSGVEFTVRNLALTDGNAGTNNLQGGGAIYADTGTTLNVVNSYLANNYGGNYGGAIAALGAVNVVSSTIFSNYSDRKGGGIFTQGPATIINTTMQNNAAAYYGGAIFSEGALTISSSTITSNFDDLQDQAGFASGAVYHTSGATLDLHNSVVASNSSSTSNTTSNFAGGGLLSYSGYSFLDLGAPFQTSTATQVGPSAGLGPVVDNGGPVLTKLPQAGSPLIGAGSTALLPVDTFDVDNDGDTSEALPISANGEIRALGGVDIGAAQVARALVVDTLTDEDDSDYTAGDLSLREAIDIARNGDTITFDPLLAGGIIRLDAALGSLVIDGGKQVSIDGNADGDADGIADITITGDTAGDDILQINSFGQAVTHAVSNTNYSDNVRAFYVANAGSAVNLHSLVITGGYDNYGGGLRVSTDASLSLTDVTVSGNVATSSGAGIFVGAGRLVVDSSTISDNFASNRGGGIFSNTSMSGFEETIITNSTIFGNQAGGYGGGVHNQDGRTGITNSTITQNTATTSGNGISSFGDNFTRTTLTSTIVADNGAGLDIARYLGYTGSFLSGGYNLIGNDNSGELTGGTGDQIGTTASPLSAGLGTLTNNGGATETASPQVGSLALNAGNPGALTEDQTGGPREIGQADVGAVESVQALVVDTLVDENDGDISAGDLSLREAIGLAGNLVTITFDPTLMGGVIHLDAALGRLLINSGQGLIIDGNIDGDMNGIADITISGDTAGDDATQVNSFGQVVTNADANTNTSDNVQVLEVTGPGTSVQLSSLVITGGNAGAGGYGGGIELTGGAQLTAINVTVAGNIAPRGGGIRTDESQLSLSYTTISGNRATYSGSGIHTDTDTPGVNATFVSNSTISGNTAQTGGGVFNRNGYSFIYESTITDNTAASGSGISSFGDAITQTSLKSTIVAGNTGSQDVQLLAGTTNSFASGGRNLIGNDQDGLVNGTGDQTGDATTPLDAGLGALTNNGGANETHMLQPGSLAIDNGDSFASLDQTGGPRALGKVDVGAVEQSAVLTVSTLTDEMDSDFSDGDLSLREALSLVDDGGTIHFDPSLAGGVLRLDAALDRLVITDKTVTIDGNADGDARGIADIVISGDTGNDDTTTTDPFGNTVSVASSTGIDNRQIFAIYGTSDLTLNSLVLTGGKNFLAGAIYTDQDTTLNLNKTSIVGNATSVGEGGGLFLRGAASISESSIFDNITNDDGGGIFVYSTSTVIIDTSTISGNTAADVGAIYNRGDLQIFNSTISNNAGSGAGGIWDSGEGTLYLRSTIIADQQVTGFDIAGFAGLSSISSGGYNVIGYDGSGITPGTGDQIETTSGTLNVALGALADNGGATPTMNLMGGSVAINAGAIGGLATDQNGNARVIGPQADAGAVESTLALVVDTLTDEDDGDFSTGDLSLREAIGLVADGGEITFDAALAGGIIRLDATLGVLSVTGGKAISIDGNVNGDTAGIADITISGDAAGDDLMKVNSFGQVVTYAEYNSNSGDNVQVLEVTGANSSVDLSSLVITGGGSSGGTGLFTNGGGLYVGISASASLTDVTVAGNFSENIGGGIAVADGALTVEDSTISGNLVTSILGAGGGVFSNTETSGTSITTITNSTIYDNLASFGGGIYNRNGRTDVSSSTVSGNDGGFGSGIASYGGGLTTTTLTSTIVAGNTGSEDVSLYNGTTNSFISGGYNLIGNDDDGLIVDFSDQTGTAAAPLDPGLYALGNNGGATETHALTAASLALSAGDSTLPSDQTGGPRNIQGVDVGAVEFRDLLLVDTLVDEMDGNYAANDLSLREAINLVADGGFIGFQPALAGTIFLDAALGPLNIFGGKTLTIDGNADGDMAGRADIIISGDTGQDDTTRVDEMGNTVTDADPNTNTTDNSRVFGIYGTGTTVNLNSLVITGGYATDGGGLYTSSGTDVRISKSTITGNEAGFYGGAIRSGGDLTITDSTISRNFAVDEGGGLYLSNGGDVTIRNSTIESNVLSPGGVAGQAIQNVNSNLTITNSTITANYGLTGTAAIESGSAATTTLASSIVAGNSNNDDLGLSGGTNTFTSGGHNIIGSDEDGVLTPATGDQIGNDAAPLDPGLASLFPNGGPTATFDLFPDSIALNAGSNPDNLITDQEGTPREIGQTDVGSVENNSVLVVDTLVDESDGDFSAGDLSLREAIELVTGFGNITFDAALAGGTIHLDAALGSLVIDGGKLITIEGNIDGDSQNTPDIILSGDTAQDDVTRTDSFGRTLTDVAASGGVRADNIQVLQVLNPGTEVTLNNLVITGGYEAGGGHGGAINAANGAGLYLFGSTLTGNVASGSGGGIYAFDTTLNITDSTISNNTAVGVGGGIFNNDFTGAFPTTITNSTIANNSAVGTGGGILNAAGSLEILNSTISGNFAGSGGAGVFHDNSGPATLDVTSTIIAGNIGSDDVDLTGTAFTFTSGGYNLIGVDGTGGGYFTGPGDQAGTSGSPIDPLLGPLGNNFGGTETFNLLTGSPALDGGTAGGLPTDQRGFLRLAGNAVDIGAVEGDDFGQSPNTAGSVSVGGSATGEILQRGDRDWFAVDLTGGRHYIVDLFGSSGGAGGGTLPDTVIDFIRDPNLAAIPGTFNDDFEVGSLNSRVFLTAPLTGTHYIEARGFFFSDIGTYTLAVTEIPETVTLTNAGGGVAGAFQTITDAVNAALDGFTVTVGAGYNDGSNFEMFPAQVAANNLGVVLPDPALLFIAELVGSGAQNITHFGSGAADITGNGFANAITTGSNDDSLRGEGGNDTLNGGAGADQMAGGLGDDTYIVDNAGDVVTETGAGTDTVRSSVSFNLTGQPLENLELTGTGNIDGTGNSLANMIIGNSGNNVIDGGAGADMMAGGLGDDTFIVDNAGDTVSDTGAGTDTVRASVSFNLTGAPLENLELTGTGDINGTGNSFANMITGNAGRNFIDGGAGADTMAGGLGDDTYTVDNVGDVVTETGAGLDEVFSSVSFTLAGQPLEGLQLTGTGNINGTGNSLVNVIVGNSGNNRIDGGAGADFMLGGLGDDTFVVDNVGDTVSDTGNGIDTVESTVDFSLAGAAVERLILKGSAINGTGNSLNNSLFGTSSGNIFFGGSGNDFISAGGGSDVLRGEGGNDTLDGGNAFDFLDGGADADEMRGGAGGDIYVVDNIGDVIIDIGALSDIDTVRASVSFSLLGQALDILELQGSGDIDGTGNGLSNRITGNSGNNTLDGGGGNDTIDGGAGSDILRGGSGDDLYIVNNTGDVVQETGPLADIDTVQSAISFTLLGQALDHLTLTGSGDINGTGNGLANTITGNSGNNLIEGGGGIDRLDGGAGNDQIRGGGSGDVLLSSAGKDLFWGDQAGDVFVFTDAGHIGNSNAERDVIFDFQQGADKINLVGIDAITGGADDAFSFIGATAFSGTAGELRASAIATNTLIEGDLDGNGTGDFQLVLIGNYVLNGGDFFL